MKKNRMKEFDILYPFHRKLSVLSCIRTVPKLLNEKDFGKPGLNYDLNLIIDNEIKQYDKIRDKPRLLRRGGR